MMLHIKCYYSVSKRNYIMTLFNGFDFVCEKKDVYSNNIDDFIRLWSNRYNEGETIPFTMDSDTF